MHLFENDIKQLEIKFHLMPDEKQMFQRKKVFNTKLICFTCACQQVFFYATSLMSTGTYSHSVNIEVFCLFVGIFTASKQIDRPQVAYMSSDQKVFHSFSHRLQLLIVK